MVCSRGVLCLVRVERKKCLGWEGIGLERGGKGINYVMLKQYLRWRYCRGLVVVEKGS